jgi:hypothetical protein
VIKLKHLFDNIVDKNPEDDLKNEIYMDDGKFLRKWWKKSVNEVEEMLKKIQILSDRNKTLVKSIRKNIAASIYKKEGLWINGKLKYLEQILKLKQNNGDQFIPQEWR